MLSLFVCSLVRQQLRGWDMKNECPWVCTPLYVLHRAAAQLILMEPNYFFHLKHKGLERKSMPFFLFPLSKTCNKRHQSTLQHFSCHRDLEQQVQAADKRLAGAISGAILLSSGTSEKNVNLSLRNIDVPVCTFQLWGHCNRPSCPQWLWRDEGPTLILIKGFSRSVIHIKWKYSKVDTNKNNNNTLWTEM